MHYVNKTYKCFSFLELGYGSSVLLKERYRYISSENHITNCFILKLKRLTSSYSKLVKINVLYIQE